MNLVILAQAAAQESEPSRHLMERLLHPSILVFLIPITAILAGAVVGVTKLLIRHRERMTMIENGFDPDASSSV